MRRASEGSPVNGARSVMSLSRLGTCVFQSPPSSASTQSKVADSVERQRNSRGPVGTPPDGHGVGQRQRGELAHDTPLRVPELHLRREAFMRGQMRIGPVSGLHEDVAPVRRGPPARRELAYRSSPPHARCPRPRARAERSRNSRRVPHRARVLQHVARFISAAGPLPPMDSWMSGLPGARARRAPLPAPVARLDEQRLLIRHPL